MKNVLLLLIVMFASTILVSCVRVGAEEERLENSTKYMGEHEYIQNISYGAYNIYNHKGGCVKCEQRNIFLMDSIVKANK
jgi:hypothetical protein